MAFLDIDKYNEFVSGFGVDARLIKTQLFSAFNFSINNVAVGVATLNSAWRATGRANDEDCGSLLVGERQVELAGAQIKNCNVKIAMMHHPMNWLSARDFQHVQRAVARNFDVLLHGHVHETEGMSLVSPHNNLIVCGAGCLYQSREYFNGYSIIDFDMSGNIFRQEAREYYGARNSFGSTSRFADGGVFESSFKGDASINFTLPESSVERISESINEQLISYSISDVAPDDIDDLFVEPRLSEEAPNELLPAAKGEKSAIDSSNLVSLPEIETQPGNYFIWGGGESGKTTILNYLALRVIRKTALTGSLAFVVDGKGIRNADAVIKSMVSFCDGAFKRADIEKALISGRAIVFVDNCPVDPSAVEFEILRGMVSKFKKCKFVFCAKDEFRLTLVNNKLPDLGVPVKQLFLQPFTRRQVRDLIKKWFGHDEARCGQLVDEVLRVTRMLGLPRSPFLMSMIIWLNEKNIKFSPVNYATLIEGFIEGLLEKLNDSNFRSESYTFRTKQHFLCELAAVISESPDKSLTSLGLQQFAIEYFQSRPQPNAKPLELLEHFFRRGILLEVGDLIRFKLDCFREYFVAKKMLEDSEYRDSRTSPDNILNYSGEIDYYSALKQDDLNLVKIAKDQLDKKYRASELTISSEDYIRVASHESSILQRMKEKMDELVHLKPSNEDRERFLDALDEARVGTPVGKAEESDAGEFDAGEESEAYYDDKYAEYMRSLILASKVLRNSELVGDGALIEEMFSICVEHWSKNVIFSLAQMDILGEEFGYTGSDVENKIPEAAIRFVRTMLPLFFLGIMKETLGTAKLADVMTDYMRNPENSELSVMLATMLYAELGLPKYFDHLEDFVRRSKLVAGSRETVLIRMWAWYLYRRLTNAEQSRLELLMSEVSKAVTNGTEPITKAERSSYVRNIRNKLNMIKLVSPDSVGDR